MSPLKQAIFVEVRKSFVEVSPLNDEELNILIFHHPAGLRLSLAGFRMIRKIFTAYSFEIPVSMVTRHQRNMSNMEYPYYLTTKRLVLFSEMDAMTVKLTGGIQQFLENCSTYE